MVEADVGGVGGRRGVGGIGVGVGDGGGISRRRGHWQYKQVYGMLVV